MSKRKSLDLLPFVASCLLCFCLQSAASGRLKPFLAGKDATAVIICPGGSYCWLDMETEGIEVAQWLQANGISAFVLKYRVQGIVPYITHSRLLFKGKQYPDAQNDLQQALTYVREHADELGVNPNRIGVMGFSAGGHLALCSMNNRQWAMDNGQSPNFIAAIYPVVSMSHPCSHKRSRRALLGEYKKRDRKMRDSLSIERHVPKDCPPVFLVNCKDDRVVKCRNSELLDSALTAQGIEHRYIQYRTGGHGFGASETKGTAECRAWKNEFITWIKSLAL
ncbi:MAG: alpha/beta hydrolase [Bacteroidaceae bacterium]|nr:alpha/beta hydrolase [Bacteroidaceae bacterium]